MIPPVAPAVAFVRAVPDAYAECLGGSRIDVTQARVQHAAYVEALQGVGAEVRWLPPADGLPDAVFVEDVAVVLSTERTLLTRPGAPSRRAEVSSAETELAGLGAVDRVPPGVTIDGGDVLRWGSSLFVGLSSRTSAGAVEALSAPGISVIPVAVRAGLHLKSACSLLDEGTLLCVPERFDDAPLRAAGLDVVAAPEEAGANVLAFGQHVLVSAAASGTAELIRARGYEAISLDIEQFQRGDGALSCLSLRVPPPGGWCV